MYSLVKVYDAWWNGGCKYSLDTVHDGLWLGGCR